LRLCLRVGKYIFPGADASCPLSFPVSQLERAGFEVGPYACLYPMHAQGVWGQIHRVENTGVHYSLTIKAWYYNWKENRCVSWRRLPSALCSLPAPCSDIIVKTYGEWWFRLWMIFLAWSTSVAMSKLIKFACLTCMRAC